MKKVFRHVLVLSFAALLPIALSAQNKGVDPPLQGLDEDVARLMKEWRVPGLAIAIVKDGKVIHALGLGIRDVNRGLKVTPETLFPIASCTKSYTAAALAILVDEGRLNWDTPVKEYWRDVQLSDEYATSHITVRDLLAHRSGLPQHYRMYFHSSLSRKEIVERVRFLTLSKELRASFLYSNLNYVVAAHMLERITGKTWEEFVQQRLFTPLAMNASNFSIPSVDARFDYALPYREENGEIKDIAFLDVGAMGPAGSISSSALEMANWLVMHLNRGAFQGRQIISERNIREMHTPQTPMPSMASDEIFYSSYGMGWAITSYRGHVMLSHGGGFDGFSGVVSFLPRDNIGIVVLSNLEGNALPSILTNTAFDRLLGLSAIPWNQRIKDRMAKAKEAARSASREDECKSDVPPAHPLEAYSGSFHHPAYGTLLVIKQDGQLQAVHNGLTSPLRHCRGEAFESISEEFGNFKLTFFSGEKGTVDRVAIPFEPTVGDIMFVRVAGKR